MSRWIWLLVLAGAALPADNARRTPPWERPRETARFLFLENCSVCHEVAKPKSAKIGPSLLRFKKAPAERSAPFRQYIVTKIRGGGIAMPPFKDFLTEAQAGMVADYLLPEK